MLNKRNMNVNEITPNNFKCSLVACPSVFETDEGKLFIIGKKLDNENIPDEVRKNIGSDEMVIEVPKNLITELDLFKKE